MSAIREEINGGKVKKSHLMKGYPAYRSPLVKVDARVVDGEVLLGWHGAGAAIARRLFGGWVGLIEGQRPAKVTDYTIFLSCWLPPMPSDAWKRYLRGRVMERLGRRIPEMLTISVTERCPNRCRHCALPDTEGADIPWELARKVIDEVLQIGCTHIIVDGGEPALYPHLERLIRYVDKNRAIVSMFTSGHGITRKKAASLRDAGLHSMHLSLDFPNADSHDEFRGRRGVFAEARKAAENALEAGLLLDVYVVSAPHNIDLLEDFFNLAGDWGAHELSFYEIVPTGRWAEVGEVLDDEQRLKFDDFVEKAHRQKGPRLNPIPHHMNVVGCFAGRRWAHVTPRGDVFPCACIPLSYGNVGQETFSRVWRRIRADGVYNSPTCLARERWFQERYLLNQ